MGWISVKDRLPEDRKEVLVYVNISPESDKYIQVNSFDRASYGDGGLFYLWIKNEKYANRAVTHWMPLPEPPKD